MEDWALVVEGGAMRGIYSAGVLDAFIEEDYNPFKWCIGVSAGAVNIAAYLASMKGRNYRVFTEYSTQPEFVSLRKYLAGGHFIDLDWLWEETIRDMRLDLARIVNNRSAFYVGATNMKTGKIEYIRPTVENVEEVVKASSAIPVLYRNPVALGGVPYVDGGVADPIPLGKALDLGAKKIVVIRSRKRSYRMAPRKALYESWKLKGHPELLDAVRRRPEVYNSQIDSIRQGCEGVAILEVCPPESFRTSRLTKDPEVLREDYRQALEQGRELVNKLKAMEAGVDG